MEQISLPAIWDTGVNLHRAYRTVREADRLARMATRWAQYKARSYGRGRRLPLRRRGRIAKQNQFSNQLGGWSYNKRGNIPRTTIVEINTRQRTVNVSMNGTNGSTAVTIEADHDLDQLRQNAQAWQKMRIKKAVAYFMPFDASAGGDSQGTILQLSACKLLTDVPNTNSDAYSATGGQTKIFRIAPSDPRTTGIDHAGDPMRIGMFYPALQFDTTADGAAAVNSYEPGWIQTKDMNNANLVWNAFFVSCDIHSALSGANPQVSMQVYFHLTLEFKDLFLSN